ncbi:transglutaminase domain-containing protein [Paenibacillus sp. Z6-24]
MKTSSSLWVKTLLAGTILFTGLPAVTPNQAIYAASSQVTVNNSTDVTSALYNSLMNRDAEITLLYKGSTSGLKAMLQNSFENALEKDPYTQYILDSYGLSWRQNAYSARVTVTMNYRETTAQTGYVKNKVKQILSNIVSSSMNDHEKVKAIHDWVVRNVKYDETYTRYTAYEALHDGTAVCQGYALLTYELLKEAGVQNMIAEGTADGELHAWNLVNLDGKWYHLDTTWDDPVPDQGNDVQTTYYLLTDSQMKQDHKWTKTYPAANTTYHSTLDQLIAAGGPKTSIYQQLAKTLNYVSTASESEVISSAAALKSQVQAARTAGKNAVSFRYSGSLTSLKNDLRGLSSVGLKSLSYSVKSINSTNDLKVTLSWNK